MNFAKNSCAYRILAVIIASVLVLSGLCFVPQVEAYETSNAIYYVSPDGNDSASGSRQAPFKTLAKAFTAINNTGGGTVVIMGDIESDNDKLWKTANSSLNSHSKLLTITGKDPATGTVYEDAVLRYDSTAIKGPTKLEYIMMAPCRTSCFINTKGLELIVGEAVTFNNNKFVIHDGIGETQKGTVTSTNTVLDGGNIHILYMGGGYPTATTQGVTGSCNLTVNGGTLDRVIIGFDKYAANHTSGRIDGNVVVTVNGGEIGVISTSNINDENTIGGFAAVIFNNGTLSSYDIPNAQEGSFIIRSGYHGTVSATDEAGVFALNVDPGYDCYVDGVLVEESTFTVEPGVHMVNYYREEKVELADQTGAYVNGFEDGSFRPDEKLTRAQAIELVVSATTDKALIKGQYTSEFSDVSRSDWYYDSVTYLEMLCILPSAWQNELCPNENITRGEFVAIADSLLEKYPESMKLMEFVDVTADNPYYTHIMSASRVGAVTGYGDKQFRPGNDLSRAEAVTVINRYLSRVPNADVKAVFDDISGHWAMGQITAAATGIDDNTWTYDEEGAGAEFAIPEGADSAEDYVKALYYQSEYLSGKAIRDGVDVISEQIKADVLNTPNTEEIYGDKITGKKYYISESGSDSKYSHIIDDYRDSINPWKTYAGLTSNRTLKAGDAVLFERGGTYRGTITLVSGVVYGSYGEGPKPLIMMSKKNYADPSLWVQTQWENVWKCTDSLVDVGVIGYDHDLFDFSDATYDELYGDIYNMNTLGFKGPEDMKKDLAFYSVRPGDVALYEANYPDSTATIAENELYVYSTGGNPGERFSSIELGEDGHLFYGKADDVIIDNFSVKFTGGHGMGGAGGCKNRTVTNCVWSWLGGSSLSDATASKSVTNYGNAVEIYGSCNGYYVENNWMYQIYDTGVTHQFSTGTTPTAQENVYYTGNLIEYVHWGIEFYNAPTGTDEELENDYTRDVYDYYNVCRMGGYGWGSITRERTRGARLYCGASLSENYDQFTEYNIFDRCAGYLINLPSNSTETDNRNIYIQDVGCTLGLLKGTTVTCSYNAYSHIKNLLGDENAVVVIIEEKQKN